MNASVSLAAQLKACSPLRVDLMGGWSDHLTFIRSRPSRVVNIAVSLNLHSYPITVQLDGGWPVVVHSSVDLNARRNRGENWWNQNPSTALLDTIYVVERLRFPHAFRTPDGGRLVTYSAAPFQSGLGASASLTVATLKAVSTFLAKPISRLHLAELSYRVERHVHECGWQDHYAAAYGGPLLVCRSQDDDFASVTQLPVQLANLLTTHAFIVIPAMQRPNDFSWPIDRKAFTVLSDMDDVVSAFLNRADNLSVGFAVDLIKSTFRLYREIGSPTLCAVVEQALGRISNNTVGAMVLGFGPSFLVIADDAPAARAALARSGHYACLPITVPEVQEWNDRESDDLWKELLVRLKV